MCIRDSLGADADIFNGVVKELHRICKHDARLYINVPHPRHDVFLSDPTHVRPINPDVLRLYDQTLNEEWEKSNVANTPLGILWGVNFLVESTHYVLEEKYQEQVAQGKISEDEVWAMISERNNIAREIQIIWKAVKL